MQYDKQYDGVAGYKALSLTPSLCDRLLETGHLIWATNTKYRGELLIVAKPSPHNERSGCTIALANLVGIERKNGFYWWLFDNIRRVVEFPCRKVGTSLLIWDAYLDKDDVYEYPKQSIRRWLNVEKFK